MRESKIYTLFENLKGCIFLYLSLLDFNIEKKQILSKIIYIYKKNLIKITLKILCEILYKNEISYPHFLILDKPKSPILYGKINCYKKK